MIGWIQAYASMSSNIYSSFKCECESMAGWWNAMLTVYAEMVSVWFIIRFRWIWCHCSNFSAFLLHRRCGSVFNLIPFRTSSPFRHLQCILFHIHTDLNARSQKHIYHPKYKVKWVKFYLMSVLVNKQHCDVGTTSLVLRHLCDRTR